MILDVLALWYSRSPIFTTLGEMTDADKVMNPQHVGSDPVGIQIRIRINPEIWKVANKQRGDYNKYLTWVV